VVNFASEDENYLWLSFEVRDTGIGIPEEKQEAIFHSFTQASMDTTRKYGGTGLGLTITKKLVELQGGTLGVKSNFGQGSTFHFNIKLEKSGAEVTEELLVETGGKLGPLGGARILLVEDNKVNQLVASKFLHQWDLKVIIANNGQEAVDLIQRRQFDLVLMDLQMPEMDGFEATRQIRHRTDEKKALPIIALTASAAEEVRTKVIDWGMDDFVSKPFNPSELHLKISKYLQIGTHVESYLAPPKIFNADKKLKKLKNEQPLMSFAYVEEIADGNDAFYMELLILYKKQIGEISELLSENMKTRDKEKMGADAHRYRTTLVTLNAFRLKEIMEDVKNSIRKSQDLKKARLLVKEGQEICAKMDELLEEQFLKIRRNAS
jgi:CheY-like chemotaxis protein